MISNFFYHVWFYFGGHPAVVRLEGKPFPDPDFSLLGTSPSDHHLSTLDSSDPLSFKDIASSPLIPFVVSCSLLISLRRSAVTALVLLLFFQSLFVGYEGFFFFNNCLVYIVFTCDYKNSISLGHFFPDFYYIYSFLLYVFLLYPRLCCNFRWVLPPVLLVALISCLSVVHVKNKI